VLFLEKIKNSCEPFIIAEVGVNYYDIASSRGITPMQAAKLMIDAVKECGAHAVKFQTYKAKTLASVNSPAFWDLSIDPCESQYEEFEITDKFGEKEYIELYEYCQKIGVIFMTTTFDLDSVDYMEPYIPAYKIASADITNIPFLRYIAQKGKPIILSTGASTLGEIDRAVSTITAEGNNEIALMHCVLNYPTKYKDANISSVEFLTKIYPEYVIGYSDHTVADAGMAVLTAAWMYGAKIIEKHFTLDKSLVGNDHYHSAEPKDVTIFLQNTRIISSAKGAFQKVVSENEKISRLYARRSLVLIKDIKAGEKLTRDVVTFKRPGNGISPADTDKVIGLKLSRDIAADEILQWCDFK
jgi:sialic acid synthase SpsE